MAVFFAGLFFAVDLLALDLLAVDLLALDLLAVDLLAVDLLAVDFFAGVDFLAVELLALDLLAVDFFAGADFLADELLAADFAALGRDPLPVDVFLAGDAGFAPAPRAVEVALATVSLGSFFAPDTTAFSSAPARNFGTAVFFALTRSPVAGLRTMREGRTAFSKAPKPVIATFSPLATSRAMVSTTESNALDAAFLLPSKWAASASMNWLLFTWLPFRNRVEPTLDTLER